MEQRRARSREYY